MDPTSERIVNALAELARLTCERPDGTLENPNGSRTYAELLELLEGLGRVEITERAEGRVRARWVEE